MNAGRDVDLFVLFGLSCTVPKMLKQDDRCSVRVIKEPIQQIKPRGNSFIHYLTSRYHQHAQVRDDGVVFLAIILLVVSVARRLICLNSECEFVDIRYSYGGLLQTSRFSKPRMHNRPSKYLRVMKYDGYLVLDILCLSNIAHLSALSLCAKYFLQIHLLDVQVELSTYSVASEMTAIVAYMQHFDSVNMYNFQSSLRFVQKFLEVCLFVNIYWVMSLILYKMSVQQASARFLVLVSPLISIAAKISHLYVQIMSSLIMSQTLQSST